MLLENINSAVLGVSLSTKNHAGYVIETNKEILNYYPASAGSNWVLTESWHYSAVFSTIGWRHLDD